ncbi:MAG: Eco57I restriction-modification methylase domain-containing protein [Anaerolineae bacterium]|nr:Eco57I restriction-modification methylase domain-containing protein [Anaerolineae bacterium]
MVINLPQPFPDELPAAYAHRIAQWYLSWTRSNKTLGQYFTPLATARFMAENLPLSGNPMRLLDPGAGLGILACAVCESSTSDIELEAFELDDELADYLNGCLSYAQQWMSKRGYSLAYTILREDFVLTYADALYWSTSQPFDAVIANPPYFKLSKSDPRARVADRVVHGQPNIYALFMAVSAALLRPGGYAMFITPRSYAAGQYFSRFRGYFFGKLRPRMAHLFESRRDVFDEVLQESLILLAERSDRDSDVILSSSASSADFAQVVQRRKSTDEVLGVDNILHLSLTDEDDSIGEIVRAWSGSLRAYGMEISTGPVVPFRATDFVSENGDVPFTHAPLLWMQNVKPMRCAWPVRHKSQYIRMDGAEKLLLPNKNYVLLRRFSAKEERQRLTAAPYLADFDTPVIGIENHLNYIYRPGGDLSPEETRGLAALLNSSLMDTYFRRFSGNTQVSATELRALPLPPLELITELGRLSAHSDAPVDTFITELLGLYA